MNIIITEKQKNAILKVLQEQKLLTKLINKGKDYFDTSSCSTDITKKAKDWKELYSILVENQMIKNGEHMLILWGPTQTMYYTNNGINLLGEMRVSTGSWGFGNSSDNPSTSTGLMSIGRKIQANKKYQVLVGKTPINLVLGPNMEGSRQDSEGKTHIAEVTTALLELNGLEECNKNVYSRSIYIHGTNRESKLGAKASNGCVRVSNDNVLYLIKNVKSNTKVYIKP
jgi:hypothetical protein